MKRLIALSLVAGLLSSSLAIAEELLFPEESPVISLKLPNGWEAKSKSGFLYSGPADDEDYFVEFSELEATPDDGEAVMKEAKDSIADSYRKVVYGETQKANFDDLGVVILDATGEDDDGKVSMNTLLVVNEAQNKVVMLLRVATPESAPKHADENRALVNSFRTAKAEEEVTTGLVAYTARAF